MSQHFLRTKNDEQVLIATIGWDTPLNYYFLLIQNEGDKSDSFLFDNLSKDINYNRSLDFYIDVLTKFGFTIPDQLVNSLINDKINKVQNHSKKWY